MQEQFRQPGRAALGPGGVRDDAGSDPRPVTGPVPAQPADAAAASWPARMDDLYVSDVRWLTGCSSR